MTTHTGDESNNSMHAPDMHTESGCILARERERERKREGERERERGREKERARERQYFPVSSLTGSTPTFVFSALCCCCVTCSHPLELRVYKCNCSGRSWNPPTTYKQVTTRLKAVWAVWRGSSFFLLLTRWNSWFLHFKYSTAGFRGNQHFYEACPLSRCAAQRYTPPKTCYCRVMWPWKA